MENEEDIIYGIDAPARDICELSLATQGLLSQTSELVYNDMKIILFNHIEKYFRVHSIPAINFDGMSLEWFNVSKSLSFSEELSNHIVILDFFTYCCINCLHILPDLKALEEKYQPNNSSVVVIGIHSAKFDNERNSKNVSDALKRYDITHPVANDANSSLWDTLRISCWPTLLILGPGGVPLFVLMGEGHRKSLFEFVDGCVSFFENLSDPPHHLPLSPWVHLPSEESGLYYPGKITTFDKILVVSDSGNNRILIFDKEGEIQSIIGSGKRGFEDGKFSSCSFNNPQGVTYHSSGVIYVADTDNHAIRKVNLSSQIVVTIAGTGKQGSDLEGGNSWTVQELSSPWDLALGHSLDCDINNSSNLLFIAMAGSHQIWGLFLTDGLWIKNKCYPKGTVVRLAGSGEEENRNTSYPLKAGFAQPSGISVKKTSEGETILIADSESSSIREIVCKTGVVRRILGGGIDPKDLFAYGDRDGGPEAAKFQHPLGIAISSDFKIYVADSYNNKVKVIEMIENRYTSKTLFGGDDTSLYYKLNEPGGLCLSEDENTLYVVDTNNFCIKEYGIENRSIKQINLTFPGKIAPSSTDITDSSDSFVFYLNERKKDLELQIKVELPDSVHFTPKAKQSYSFTTSDNVSAKERDGIINSLTFIPICVDLTEKENATLNLSTKLYVCHDSAHGACTIKTYSVQIQFFFNEDETVESPLVINIQPKFIC